ncbi:MAG: hypothetical protein AB7T05_05495 [Fimbriimonadaceae bacterium]
METSVGALFLGLETTLSLKGRSYRMTAVDSVADQCVSRPDLEPELVSESLRADTRGAEAILYRISVARLGAVSPMEYGGRFLEHDRALLESAGVPTVVLVSGPGAYLDIIAALPCTVIAWRQAETPAEPASLGAACLTCTDAEGADLLLEVGE